MTEKQVIDYTTIGRANLNRMYRAGEFPAPLQLSSHKVGWLKHEVDEWIRRLPRPRGPNGGLVPPFDPGPSGGSQPPAWPPSTR
jgi:predicted DNA-binding transcriptional regulator AlpA